MSRRTAHIEFESREDALLHRARRMRRKGKQRQAMMALREACFSSEADARLWTLFAVQCLRAGRDDEAEKALVQAVWLRQRCRDERRAASTQALLDQLRAGELKAA